MRFHCIGVTGELVEEILETGEAMDTEEIADLLEEARAEVPESDESFAMHVADQSHEEGSEEEGLDSEDDITDEEDSLSEDRYNSAGEEVRVGVK